MQHAGAFFVHPLNRALLVLLVFALLGIATILVDRTSVPQARTEVSRSVSGREGKVGCLVEVGMKGVIDFITICSLLQLQTAK